VDCRGSVWVTYRADNVVAVLQQLPGNPGADVAGGAGEQDRAGQELAPEHRACNQLAHNLRGAAVDPLDAGIGVKA
jgi:hypothetical protein